MLHEREDPVVQERPHSCRGSAESLRILVSQEDAALDVDAVKVLRQGVPEVAAPQTSGVAGLKRRRNDWNVRGIHEPGLGAESPGEISSLLLMVPAEGHMTKSLRRSSMTP